MSSNRSNMALSCSRAQSNGVITALTLLSALCVAIVTSIPVAEYEQMRRNLIASEQAEQLGGTGSTLTPDEKIVNDIMMQEKRAIIEASRVNGSDFPVRHNFLNGTARAAMEATRGYQIIRKMPKGGVLHVHDEAIATIDWLVKNATYRDHCYMCVGPNYNVKFHFYNTPPTDDPNCVWRLVSDFRDESGDISTFDQTLHNNISMVTAHPDKAYPNIDAVWNKFMDYFGKVEGLMFYTPVFRDYVWEGLKYFRQDNIQYIEIRALLMPIYELDGSTHNSDYVLGVYKNVSDQFVRQYPDFTGVRIIKSSLRFKPDTQMLADVKEAMRMYTQNPGFVVGFDLVGQEDPLHPLIYYIDELLYPYQQQPPVRLPYFFHAGETNWQETATDYNLVDAILLNTTRIGHGYALYKHPVLMQRIKQGDMAVEINPISNQVLKLVEDPRNHPATFLMAQNYPVVISSDDPVSWEATPLSHDFYVTFMALIGEDMGLSTLKQLAVNSLRYSSLPASEKQQAMFQWRQKWDVFIHDVINEYRTMPTVTNLIG